MSNQTILVVDDDPAILRLIMRCFQETPFDVVPCRDPALVLQDPALHSPAVIVSDLNLPGMDGIDFLYATTELWPRAQRILFSGYIDVGVAQRAIEMARIFRLLTKPCSVFELREAIESALCEAANLPSVPSIRKSAMRSTFMPA